MIVTLKHRRLPSVSFKEFRWSKLASAVLGVTLGASALNADLPAPWRFADALPQGNDLLAAWAFAPDNVLVGGHGGMILRWNGVQWTRMATPTQKTVFAIHGTSPTDIWAVGGDAYTDNIAQRCLVMHYNGLNWSEFTPPDFSGYTYPMNSVWAIAPNDVWAGQDGGSYVGHYDGTRWELVPIPLAVAGTSSFKAVTALGTNHLYFAGTHGQIVHRDQGVWHLEQQLETGSFSQSIIASLWAHDADNVFACGNWNQLYRRKPDRSWESLPAPPSGPFGSGFFRVWGTSPSDVYFMEAQAIVRYDGTTPLTKVDFSLGMRRQWLAGCGAGDRLFGAGPNGVVHEYVLNSPGGGTLSALTVGGHSNTRITEGGASPCGPHGVLFHGFVQAYDDAWPLFHTRGVRLERFPSLPPGAAPPMRVKAVLASGLDDVLVAWESLYGFPRDLSHWDGTQWTSISTASEARRLWRSPSGKVYAAGPYRVLRQNSVSEWEVLHTIPVDEPETVFSALWGRSDNEIYAGTENGRILRYNGSSWQTETTPASVPVVGIAGTSTDTYAVGANGAAWRRSGLSWQQLAGVTVREGEGFSAITGGPDGVYAAQRTPEGYIGGNLGRVWRFQGSTAQMIIRGLSQPLVGLSTNGSGHLYGISTSDFIVTTAPESEPVTLQKIDLGRDEWQMVGSSGLAFRPETDQAGSPVVAIQRVSTPPDFGGPEAESAHGEHWIVLEESFNSGSSLPPLLIQVAYDPARLPIDWSSQPLGLYRYDDGWTEIPSVLDPVAHTLTTTEPVDFSVWTLGPATVTPSPAITVTGHPAGHVTLAWPASATGFTLQWSASLGASTSWSAADEKPEPSGDLQKVILTPTADHRFFRLVRP